MRNKQRRPTLFIAVMLVVLLAGCVAAGPVKPPEHPAEIGVHVADPVLGAGQRTTVTVRLEPLEGIKINRYPKTRLVVSGEGGLVAAGEASVGNDTPPAPEKMATNYFDHDVEPLELTLQVAEGATPGAHHVDATLTYFYCVPASGFCAPKREALRIPLTVR